VDPEDPSLEHTALRETNEELGVAQSEIELVGGLDEILTVTDYHVAPIAGVVDPGARFLPNADEVARVFSVPVSALLDEAGWETHLRTYKGSTFRVWNFPYDGEDIWGATAQMLRNLLAVLRQSG
jgi:8-oxo-dGTP pyrophosphatase MutT (NUDIX family)